MYLNSWLIKNKIDFSVLIFNNKRSIVKRVTFLQNHLNGLFLIAKTCLHHLGVTLTFFKTVWNSRTAKLPKILTYVGGGTFIKRLVFSKYYYNGLGYKIFLRNNYLFIWVGLTHYTILHVPDNIKIFAKKRRIFIVGLNKLKFNEFLLKIRQIRKMDLYKGKGLLEVKSYKGFIKMKSGKRKQY